MDQLEKEMIMKGLERNSQLKRLYNQHHTFDEKLQKLAHRSFLTSEEQLEAKLLKKKKLQAKDRMMELLNDQQGEARI